ncbi:MAG: phage tail sheath subtilisin-like domain-containing protein [Comamonadaceae bacterium]|nr:phage tail sheath subtilisin-like domain-containing protein [Comamonadaceae bacterium]
MSLAEYHHGVRVQELSDGSSSLKIVSTAIIGLIGTAPNATSDLPVNEPRLFTSMRKAIAAAGNGGTLKSALEAIASQSSPVVVVIRVEEGQGSDDDEKAADQISKTVGTTTGNQYTGVQLLRTVQAKLGVKPRIIGAPGLDAKPVVDAMVSVAQSLRAFVYASAWGATDVSSALNYRNQFGARELMIIWPHFKHWSTTENASVPAPTVAYAMGLRAKIDQTQGWHKTLTEPPLIKQEVAALKPADLVALGVEVVGFFVPQQTQQ